MATERFFPFALDLAADSLDGCWADLQVLNVDGLVADLQMKKTKQTEWTRRKRRWRNVDGDDSLDGGDLHRPGDSWAAAVAGRRSAGRALSRRRSSSTAAAAALPRDD